MLGAGERSVCTDCHKAGDRGFDVAGALLTRISDLQNALKGSHEILDRAERAGMEVSRPKFELREGTDALTHARVLIHSTSAEEVEKVTGPGLEVARKGLQAGR